MYWVNSFLVIQLNSHFDVLILQPGLFLGQPIANEHMIMNQTWTARLINVSLRKILEIFPLLQLASVFTHSYYLTSDKATHAIHTDWKVASTLITCNTLMLLRFSPSISVGRDLLDSITMVMSISNTHHHIGGKYLTQSRDPNKDLTLWPGIPIILACCTQPLEAPASSY